MHLMFMCMLGHWVASTVLSAPNPFKGCWRVSGQLRGDKECPFSGVTQSGRVRRKVPESDARSVPPMLTPAECSKPTADSNWKLTANCWLQLKTHCKLLTPTENLVQAPDSMKSQCKQMTPAENSVQTPDSSWNLSASKWLQQKSQCKQMTPAEISVQANDSSWNLSASKWLQLKSQCKQMTPAEISVQANDSSWNISASSWLHEISVQANDSSWKLCANSRLQLKTLHKLLTPAEISVQASDSKSYASSLLQLATLLHFALAPLTQARIWKPDRFSL